MKHLTPRRAAILGLTLWAVVPASADAGTYHQWGCKTPTGQAAPSDGWDGGGTPPGAIISSCASGGGVGVLAGDASGIAGATLTYAPGPNLVATSATLWRTARAYQSAVFNQPPYPLSYFALSLSNAAFDAQGGYYALEQGYGDNSGTPNGPTVGSSLGTNMDTFDVANRVIISPLPLDKPQAPMKLQAECTQWSGNFNCDARYLIGAYDIQLRDDTAPVAGVVAGTLVNGTGKIDQSGGPIVGTRSVIVLGSDTGSGLYRAIVEVDGNEVSSGRVAPPTTGANRCQAATAGDGLRAFVVRQPCPLSGSATASWDSTAVKDGAHDVRVLWEDASGNKTVVAAGKVLVRNDPMTGPGSPEEFRGDVNGTIATDTAALSVYWPITARKASTRKSVIRKCKSPKYVAKHVIPCQGRAAGPDYGTTWSRTKLASIAGRLTDSAGQPIANAAVVLTTTPQAAGQAARPLATLTTDPAGAFTMTLPRSAGSQTITAQWMARSGDTRPAAAATATLRVKSATGLNAPRTARRGGSVTFSGTLRGKAGAMTAVPVTLEVRYRGRWKTFANASTDGNGKWKVKVKKFATQRGRYLVRANTGTSTTYPFAAGGGTRNVTVSVR